MIKNTKKYIINLKRREDRKINSIKEMEYIGWNNYEFFEGIDTNSYEGCGLSHMAIANKLLESNEEYIIALEDDIQFMPWAKKLIDKLDEKLQTLQFDILHFAPSIHRPLEATNDIFVKLHDCAPADPKHRGIFGTSGFLYNRKVAEKIVKWDTNHLIDNTHKYLAIDEFFNKVIYPTTKSFCPKYPLVTQRDDFSNINKTFDKNHYLMLYQWDCLIAKIPECNDCLDIKFIMEQREKENSIIDL